MPLSFDEHESGCRPLAPCRNCRVVGFLRLKLSIEDLETLDKLLTNESDGVLDRSVNTLNLSVRSSLCLKNDNIETIRQLVAKTEAELLRGPNFGRKSLNEIRKELAGLGLKLKGLR